MVARLRWAGAHNNGQAGLCEIGKQPWICKHIVVGRTWQITFDNNSTES